MFARLSARILDRARILRFLSLGTMLLPIVLAACAGGDGGGGGVPGY